MTDDDVPYEAIEEAIQNLAREGLIIDTGLRRWSERAGCYQIVWRAAPSAKLPAKRSVLTTGFWRAPSSTQ